MLRSEHHSVRTGVERLTVTESLVPVGAGDGDVLGETVGAADVGSTDGASLGVPVGAALVGAGDGAALGLPVGAPLGVSLGASVTGVLVD